MRSTPLIIVVALSFLVTLSVSFNDLEVDVGILATMECSSGICPIDEDLDLIGSNVYVNTFNRFRIATGKTVRWHNNPRVEIQNVTWDGNYPLFGGSGTLDISSSVVYILNPFETRREYFFLSNKLVVNNSPFVPVENAPIQLDSCVQSVSYAITHIQDKPSIKATYGLKNIQSTGYSGCILYNRVVPTISTWKVDGTVKVNHNASINFEAEARRLEFRFPKAEPLSTPYEVVLFDLSEAGSKVSHMENLNHLTIVIKNMDSNLRDVDVYVTKGSLFNLTTIAVDLEIESKSSCYKYVKQPQSTSEDECDIIVKFKYVVTDKPDCFEPMMDCPNGCTIPRDKQYQLSTQGDINVGGTVIVEGYLKINGASGIIVHNLSEDALFKTKDKGHIIFGNQFTIGIKTFADGPVGSIHIVKGSFEQSTTAYAITSLHECGLVGTSDILETDDSVSINLTHFRSIHCVDCEGTCILDDPMYIYYSLDTSEIYTLKTQMIVRRPLVIEGKINIENVGEDPVFVIEEGGSILPPQVESIYIITSFQDEPLENITLIGGDVSLFQLTNISVPYFQSSCHLGTTFVVTKSEGGVIASSKYAQNLYCMNCEYGCNIDRITLTWGDDANYLGTLTIVDGGFLHIGGLFNFKNTRKAVTNVAVEDSNLTINSDAHEIRLSFDQSYLLSRIGDYVLTIMKGKIPLPAEKLNYTIEELAETKCFTITETEKDINQDHAIVKINIQLIDECELSIDRSEPEAYEDVVICDGHNSGNKEESIVRTCTFDEDTDILYGEQLSIGNGETFELNDIEIDSRIGSNVKVIPDLVERIEKSIPVFNVSGEYGKVYLSGKLTIVIDEGLLSYFRDSDVKRHSEKLIIVSGNHHVDETLTPSIEMDDKYTSCFNVNVDPSPENNDEEYSLIIQVDSVISESCNSLLIPGDDDDGGLGLGAIIGIAVGGAVLVALVIIIIVVVTIRRSKSKKDVVVPVKSDLKIETSDKIGDDSDSDSESPEYEDESGSGSEETESEESGEESN